MDRDQDDPDQEQNPGNLDRDRGHPGEIQGAGNHADHQKHKCVVEHGSLLSMEFGRKLTSALEYGWRPGRLHKQTMTQGMQPFRETLASERRRLRNQSRETDQEA